MLHSPPVRDVSTPDGVTPSADPAASGSKSPHVPTPPVPNTPRVPGPSACDAMFMPPESQIDTLNAMQLKPPEMDTTDIQTFFFALENWFDAWNITTNQHIRRFNILRTRIPLRVLPELRPLLENIRQYATDRYEVAKRAIIEHFEESQRSRLHRLLAEMNLGDRKPSQLLAEMRRAANGAMTDSMLVDLWIGRLPPYVQSAVIATNTDTNDRAKVADSVMDSFALYHRTGPYQTIHEVRNEDFERLSRQVTELGQRLDAVLSRLNERERERPRSRTRQRQLNQEAVTPSGHCYYHTQYGQAARNCRPPCSFNNRRQGSNSATVSD
ncbi:uncharacterized protein LOC120901235 [Anopheles arabiensis]|uniref:uncharacterized protein LOC120901235 n=1 Tax=Anopheles arabiensis TaxID=7173 RepID=UPI001AAD511F|nr:uncharacterized protein LOC120901235 [Anopheles arabiensis]